VLADRCQWCVCAVLGLVLLWQTRAQRFGTPNVANLQVPWWSSVGQHSAPTRLAPVCHYAVSAFVSGQPAMPCSVKALHGYR